MHAAARALAAATLPVLASLSLSSPAAGQGYTAELVHAGFDSPVFVTAAPGDDERLFVAEQAGKIKVVEAEGSTSVMLDIADLVDLASQQGLMGFAFHPDYQANGYFYVYYVAESAKSVLVRYQVPTPSSYAVDLGSESILFAVEGPISFHYGGGLAFGPDGKLWLAVGDLRVELAGNGCSAQDPSSLVGKLLRLEDDGSIPADNPYVGDPSVRDEIWALGLRQPFRMSFDSATGDLFIGDVGESSKEEINVVPAGTFGQNFGWRVMEGSQCTQSPECSSIPCPSGSFTEPVTEWGHFFGCCAIGGYVYRGSAIPELQGFYLFGDWCTGEIAAFRYNGVDPVVPQVITETMALGSSTPIDHISSFGTDNQGELYIVDGGQLGVDGTGEIFKVVPKSLVGDVPQVSVSGGGTQELALDAGSEFAGDLYAVAGTTTGISPGIPFGSFTIPLNVDFYFFVSLTGDPPLFNQSGTLDAAGRAAAAFALPPNGAPALVGTNIHHAFVVLEDGTLQLVFVSNPEPLDLVL